MYIQRERERKRERERESKREIPRTKREGERCFLLHELCRSSPPAAFPASTAVITVPLGKVCWGK